MFVNVGDGATSDLYFALLLALLIVYLCYAISIWSKKAALGFRCIIYFILVTSFIARKFLLVEFGLQLTPSTFSLLQETNGHEVSGFLDIFILSKIGLKYLLIAIGLYLIVFASDMLFVRKMIATKCSEKMKLVFGGIIGLVFVMCVPAIRGGMNSSCKFLGDNLRFQQYNALC